MAHLNWKLGQYLTLKKYFEINLKALRAGKAIAERKL
jgi:hypothetical protein